MAGELSHIDVGSQLSKTEWESITAHALDGQTTGDIIYASSSSQLSRIAIGSVGNYLGVVGGIPAWTNTPILLADGAADAPAWGFINDDDSGVYLRSVGLLGLTVAGTGRVGITSTEARFAVKVSFGTAISGTDFSLERVDASNLRLTAGFEIDGDLNHDGTKVGFYGTVPVSLQTGVAVSAAGLHAALVNLGMITA